MLDYDLIASVHTDLISANEAMKTVYECVETDEYRLAVREIKAVIAEFQPSTEDPSSIDVELWKKFLNAQRTFIRAQYEMLNMNNVYGDSGW